MMISLLILPDWLHIISSLTPKKKGGAAKIVKKSGYDKHVLSGYEK